MIWMALCCDNCCKAKNNARCRGSIRFLKFVLQAYQLAALFSSGSRNAWAFHEWHLALQVTQTSSLNLISLLDSCAWITFKTTYAQACPTLRRMTHFVCQFHTSDCSMCTAEVIWRHTSFVSFVEFGETSSLSWTGLILQTITQNTTCHPESIAYSSLQYLV